MTTSIYDLLNPGNQPTASVVNNTDNITLGQSGVLSQGTIAQLITQITATFKPVTYAFSADSIGAKGDGVTDDTAAFLAGCTNNMRLVLTRGKTYLVRHLVLSGLSNFELDGNGATIVSDQTQSILGFSATAWGTAANIYVHDLSLYYTNSPSSRTDNVVPLWFQFVNGVSVERVKVTNSWSAGIIYNVCSNVKAYSNQVSNTLADGMTCFGCGRNVTYFDNDFTSTADDAMAVTWLSGNTAAAVGETTIRTKGVRIIGNRVNGTSVSARGIYFGGVEGGVIIGNTFFNVAAFSILVDTVTSVATYSYNVMVSENVLVDSGQTATSLVGEVGGIAVYAQNYNITVTNNRLTNTNNVALLLQGTITANNNQINIVTNTPSTQNPTLPWLGTGIVWADFSGSNTCYGSSDYNSIRNTVNRAIWIQAGYNVQYLSVCHNQIHDCVDPVAVGTAANGLIFLDTSTRNQVIAKGNRFYESRTTQVLTTCIYVGGGGLHDIDHVEINLASGATQPNTPIANASGGTAIKRWLQYTLSAGTIAANSTYSVNVSVADANLRDYVFVSVPYQIPGLIVSAFVQSANTVTIQVTNPTTASITPLQGNTWTVRVRRT